MSALRAAIVRGARRGRLRGDGVRTPRSGEGYEFAQLRGYVEGDDPRRIDWAATARVGALQTRVFVEETALVLAALIDHSPSMQVGRTRRLSAAADEALGAWFGAASGVDRVQRLVDERVITGARAAMHIVPRLPFALLPALRFALRVVPRGASLLAVTDAYDIPDGETEVLARIASRCDATFLLARDPWAAGLPLRGWRRLRDAESGRTRAMYFGRRERERFVLAVAQRESELLERFAGAGWRTGILDADDGRASLARAFGLR